LTGTATDSVFIGDNAGDGVTTGDQNVVIGADADIATVTGTDNVAVGYLAIVEALGTVVGSQAQARGGGVSIGYQAGNSETIQSLDNVLVGYQAGAALNSASTDNTCLGDLACDGLTTGDGNIIIGSDSDLVTATESNVVAIGFGALAGDTGGISIGYQAGGSQVAGADSNIWIGYQAGAAANSATADKNTCIGHTACDVLTSALWTTGVGYNALAANLIGNGQTGLGFQALYGATGGSNTGVGYNACWQTTTGTSNTCMGTSSSPSAGAAQDASMFGAAAVVHASQGVAIGASAENADGVSIGYQAGDASAAADVDNVFIGNSSGTAANGTSTDNTCVGDLACDGLTTGDGNTIIGADADLVTATESNVIAIGKEAKAGDTGGISIGYQAGDAQVAGSQYNTLLGYQAGSALNNSGDDANTFVGYNSGVLVAGGAASNSCFGSTSCNTLTTGDFNVILGAGSSTVGAGDNNIVAVGYGAKNGGAAGTSIGYLAGSNLVTGAVENTLIGNTAGTAINNGSADGNTFVEILM
jgi:hypothetical protein